MAPRVRAAATLLVVALGLLGHADASATPSPTHAVAGAAQNTFGDSLAIAAVSGAGAPAGLFWGGGVAVANGVPLALDCVAVTTGFSSNDHFVWARGTSAVLGTRYIFIWDYQFGSIFAIATSPAPGGQFKPCGANVAGGGTTVTGRFAVAP